MTDKERIYSFIENMRVNAIEMAHNAGKAGCHIGGSFSSMEILGCDMMSTTPSGKNVIGLYQVRLIVSYLILQPWQRLVLYPKTS